MAEHYCTAMEENVDNIMLAYDSRTEDAVVSLMAELPPESGLELVTKLAESASEAALAWREIQNGLVETSVVLEGSGGRRAQRITPDDGEADPEHPALHIKSGLLGIQK